MVIPVVDEDAVGARVDRDSMDAVQVAGPSLGRRIAALPPFHDVVAVGIESSHARIAVAVRNIEAAVRMPRHVRGSGEVVAVGSGLVRNADRLDQLLAVVREFKNRMTIVVHDPDVFLGVVRADIDRMRTAK